MSNDPSSIKSEIAKIVSGDVADDEQTLTTFSRDASVFEIKPQLVVSPKNSYDIQKLIRYINHHSRQGLSLTPRAAGTCMSGGPLSQSIVVDTMKYMNKVKKIGPDYAITQPGVFYRRFDKKTQKKNLFLPPYPASRELCAVGGMVGNNAAGERTLCYGATIDYVKKLKVVLADGKEYVFQPLNKRQLYNKMRKKDFEGQLYRKVHALLVENEELIQKAKPQTTKNSMGYYLWDVIQPDGTFDLTKILVGSQGTLGIITEIEFGLERPKQHHSLLVITLPDLNKLDVIVNDILKFKPESFECFDDQTMRYALKYFSEIADKFKICSGAGLYLQFIPDFIDMLTGSLPKLTLIADFADDDAQAAIDVAQKAQAVLETMQIPNKLINSPEFAEKYWVVRRESFSLLRGHAHHMTSAPIIDDICVNPNRLPEFLPKLFAILHKYDDHMVHTLAGHIGSGNFHIIPLMDLNDPKVRKLVPKLVKEVHALTLEFGGTLAAEHNDGLIRAPFLKDMFGSKMYSLFLETKKIFDPKGIFNPNKKVGVTLSQALKHMHYN